MKNAYVYTFKRLSNCVQLTAHRYLKIGKKLKKEKGNKRKFKDLHLDLHDVCIALSDNRESL